MQMNKEKNQKIILFSLIAIIIVYVVYNYYIMTSNQRIIELSQQIKEKRILFNDLNSFKAKKKEAVKQISQLEAATTILSEKIPDYNCRTEFTAELYSLTSSKALNAYNVNMNPSDEDKKDGVIKISLDTAGKYQDIKQVINYFKNHKRKIMLKAFRMQAKGDGTYTASLNLEMYYQDSKSN